MINVFDIDIDKLISTPCFFMAAMKKINNQPTLVISSYHNMWLRKCEAGGSRQGPGTVARTYEGFDHHETFKKHACGKWDNCKRSVPLASQLVVSCLHVHAQAGQWSVVCNLTGCFTQRSILIYLCVCFYKQFPAFHWENIVFKNTKHPKHHFD